MQTSLNSPKYRPDIDGLRAVAIISVVVFHAFPQSISGGFIGVDIFFVISGFLISDIIISNTLNDNFSFIEFYSRRIRRIFPSLFVVLTTSLFLGWLTLTNDEFIQLNKHIASGAGFVSNIVLLNESSYFDHEASTKPLLHLWSLSIEEQFYVIYPLAIFLAHKNRLNILIWLTLLWTISFALNITNIEIDSQATFFSPETRFWELISGGILACHKTNNNLRANQNTITFFNPNKIQQNKLLANAISCAGASLIAFGLISINRNFDFPGKTALIPVLGSALIIIAGEQAWINKKILSSRILTWIGLISFPLYLWHWPLLSLIRILESREPSYLASMIAVLLSITLSALTYYFLEKPIRHGNHAGQKTKILFSLIFGIGISSFCFYIFSIESFSGKRMNSKSIQLGWTIPVATERQIMLCRDKFPERSRFTSKLRDDNFCAIQREGNPDVLLIGDSMNLSIFPGLTKFNDINTLMLSASAAAPFYNVRTTDFGDNLRTNNYRMTNQALDYAAKTPDIKVVILSTIASPALTRDDSSFKIIDLSNPNEKNHKKIFTDAMERTLEMLLSKRKHVIFLMPNPTMDFNPKSCLREFRTVQISDQENLCSRTLESVNTEYENYYKWTDEILKKYPEVLRFDPKKYLCNKNKCYASIDGEILYRDQSHLSIKGSEILAPELHKLIISLLSEH